MYLPSSFDEPDQAKLHGFMEQHSFALLVSQVVTPAPGGESLPFASQLPLLLERDAGAHGTLVGHMARANPQWPELENQIVMAVFCGPHAYISPTWYETQNAVPTWNYTAVHAYGTTRVIHDRSALLEIVARSVALYERTMPVPWKLDPTAKYVDQLLPQIVGFRIEITRLEGKFKLNQNRSVEQREKVTRALQTQGGENALGVADLMSESMRMNQGAS